MTNSVHKPIRVLLFEHFGFGGLAHYAHCLCNALAERNIDVSLLTASGYELAGSPRSYRLLNRLPLWDPYVLDGRRQRPLERRLRQAGKGLRYAWALCVALVTIWREQPDILHISEMKFLPDILLVLLSRGARLVHTCHNVERFSDRPAGNITRTGPLWRCVQALMYRQCDAVIFHAEANEREFLSIFGFEPACTAVIPHGEYGIFAPADAVPMSAARQALGLAQEGQRVLFFGAIRRYKGLDVLLEAMADLRRRRPGVRLVVAGAPGRDMDVASLISRAREAGLDGGVEWRVGYVPHDRVHLYFYACDVVALPYRKVYDSGVLKIAQALGRPAVVTNVGGLPAAVDEGRAGLVVPAEDASALAEGLDVLLASPELAESLALHGRTLASTSFAWAEVARQVHQLYSNVLDGRCVS